MNSISPVEALNAISAPCSRLLFEAEDGVEIQFLHQGVMAYAHRCVYNRQRLREGWGGATGWDVMWRSRSGRDTTRAGWVE